MDLPGVLAAFGEAYERAAEAYSETNLDTWFPSGPYAGPADLARRYQIGMDQVVRYVTYAANLAAAGHGTWRTPRGAIAVELPFDVQLGGIHTRGYIDKVESGPTGLRVVDYKTGNSAGDPFQLAVYIVAIWLLYGELPTGAFWMAKSGREVVVEYPEPPVEEVTARIAAADAGIRAGDFDPKPSEANCRFCSVAASCPANFFAR